MKQTTECPTKDCGNVTEVKISTGNKNPENKGKAYIMCPKCGKFNWITSQDVKPDDVTREPLSTRDFNEEARGKIRSLFLEAYIGKYGMIVPSPAELVSLNTLVEIAMTGKTGN